MERYWKLIATLGLIFAITLSVLLWYTESNNNSNIPSVILGSELESSIILPTSNTTDDETRVIYICLNQLRRFNSDLELRNWVDTWQYKANEEWIKGEGSLTYDPSANRCTVWALQMIEDATHDGYISGLAVDTGKAHALVVFIVDNKIRFVEPQDKTFYSIIRDTYWKID